MYASALDFQGLYTFPNPLSKAPTGACFLADNVLGNRDGIAESRRGLAPGTFGVGGPPQNFAGYQNAILFTGGSGAFYNGFSPYTSWATSSFMFPPSTLGGPGYLSQFIRGVEASKNFYFTTELGIEKITSPSMVPIIAGVPPGLDGSAVLAGAGSGFLGSSTQCAYQIVFGYVDANGNLNLGSPSERILIVNAGGGSDNVNVTFTVPTGLTTSYFYQIYRTPQTTFSVTPSQNVPPGAEPQLAGQFQLTAGQITALSVTVTDVTPDVLLGAALYTNPSQQGALQTNTQPPFANDACLFSQMMFYANTQTVQTLAFSLISVGAPNGVQLNDTITVNGITFTAKAAQNNAAQQFLFVTTGTIAQNIDATARNLINCINANFATTAVYAIYLSGFNQLPGLIQLQTGLGTAIAFSQFFVTASRGGSFSPVIPPSGTTFGSSNDATPNAFYASKVGQPEAVPPVNITFVGGGDQPIFRILPLRDRVIVSKSDGVFVVTGSTPQNLSVTLLDSTIICVAPESARVLNNSVYLFSQQGVVSITESGVTIQSRAIEGDLLKFLSIPYTSPTTLSLINAVTYESERLYILNLPTVISDVYPSQAFCYNWVTNVWTHWPLGLSAGFINPFNNKLYASRGDLGSNFVFAERKTYTYEDYYDDQVTVTFNSINTPSATQQVLGITTTPSASWVGWGVTQTVLGTLYTAIIVAVNVGAKTITIDLTNSTTPGTVIPWNFLSNPTIENPIPITLQYLPMTGNFPHYVKTWGRINFWFYAGNFQRITAGFTSDINGPTPVTEPIQANVPANVSAAGFAMPIQSLVPAANSMARWIMPELVIAFPRARLSCLGVTASYEIESDVTA